MYADSHKLLEGSEFKSITTDGAAMNAYLGKDGKFQSDSGPPWYFFGRKDRHCGSHFTGMLSLPVR